MLLDSMQSYKDNYKRWLEIPDPITILCGTWTLSQRKFYCRHLFNFIHNFVYKSDYICRYYENANMYNVYYCAMYRLLVGKISLMFHLYCKSKMKKNIFENRWWEILLSHKYDNSNILDVHKQDEFKIFHLKVL